MRGAGRLCRERPKSFLAPREGSALSNLLHNGQMKRGGSRAGPEANALPHSAVESRRADADTAPVRYAGTTHRADAECSGDIAMLVMKPISSHVDKLSKVLSDPSLSDKKRYEGVLIEIASMVRLLAHRLSLGVSQRWPVNQFEQLFEDLVGEDKDLDRNGLQSLSSSLSRFQMTEQQRHRLDVLLGRFSAIYGEPV